MANRNDRSPGNVAGAFYVDNTCIDCDLCRQIAPSVFHRNDDSGLSVAFRQPSTAEEWEQAREAVASCPTDSVGDDGERV
jgi:ferredoxin